MLRYLLHWPQNEASLLALFISTFFPPSIPEKKQFGHFYFPISRRAARARARLIKTLTVMRRFFCRIYNAGLAGNNLRKRHQPLKFNHSRKNKKMGKEEFVGGKKISKFSNQYRV